jgi:hypothetical protein
MSETQGKQTLLGDAAITASSGVCEGLVVIQHSHMAIAAPSPQERHWLLSSVPFLVLDSPLFPSLFAVWCRCVALPTLYDAHCHDLLLAGGHGVPSRPPDGQG